MRARRPGPLREQRLRDEPLGPRLPERRLTARAAPTSRAPELRAPAPAAPRRATCALRRTHPPRNRLASPRRLGPPPGSERQTPLGRPSTYPSPVHTHAGVGRGRTAAGGHLACPASSRFPSTTPNSTLLIKVSTLAQAPRAPTAPRLSTHKVCPRPPQPPRQRCAHWAQRGRRTPTGGRPGHLHTVTAPVWPGPLPGAGSPRDSAAGRHRLRPGAERGARGGGEVARRVSGSGRQGRGSRARR